MEDKIVKAVCKDLKNRSKVGIKKYGTTLDRSDLSIKEWLQHAYEECLDQANYLKKSILELESKEVPKDHLIRYPRVSSKIEADRIKVSVPSMFTIKDKKFKIKAPDGKYYWAKTKLEIDSIKQFKEIYAIAYIPGLILPYSDNKQYTYVSAMNGYEMHIVSKLKKK